MQDMYNNLTGAEWAGLGTTTLGLGLGYLGKEKDLASAQAQADALKAKGLSDVEVARIMLESKKYDLEIAKSGGGKKSTNNTTLYIALGVGGVVVLGLVIFAVTRKS